MKTDEALFKAQVKPLLFVAVKRKTQVLMVFVTVRL
jgi:hypothetical protein